MRFWYLFRCETKDEAESWLRGRYAQPPTLKGIGNREMESTQTAFVFAEDDRKCRVSLNGAESNAVLDLDRHGEFEVKPSQLPKGQREAVMRLSKLRKVADDNPGIAAMVDLDYFVEDPPTAAAGEFVTSSYTRSQDFLRSLE